ncbi:hypothetical protein CC80DRAFT_14609 [Byssothecium circinans]|uniref:Uncharacterized protein n=1 Tax=Byssothecium circinans TaxID=147558 RepID=A0A6A5U148_9PLEO|nr:hypothetical protein CC80DRAFT_14609 [Byssothecium circinans]
MEVKAPFTPIACHYDLRVLSSIIAIYQLLPLLLNMCELRQYDYDCDHRATGETIHCTGALQGTGCTGITRPYFGAANGKCPACNYPTPHSRSGHNHLGCCCLMDMLHLESR